MSEYERLYGAHALRFSCGCPTQRQALEILRDKGPCSTARWVHLTTPGAKP